MHLEKKIHEKAWKRDCWNAELLMRRATIWPCNCCCFCFLQCDVSIMLINALSFLEDDQQQFQGHWNRGRAGPPHKDFRNHLTLYQGQIDHLITTYPPRFSDLPMALLQVLFLIHGNWWNDIWAHWLAITWFLRVVITKSYNWKPPYIPYVCMQQRRYQISRLSPIKGVRQSLFATGVPNS